MNVFMTSNNLKPKILREIQIICVAQEGEKQSNVPFIFTNFLTVHTHNPCLAHLSVVSIIISITSHCSDAVL